jgi:hypothetical protein
MQRSRNLFDRGTMCLQPRHQRSSLRNHLPTLLWRGRKQLRRRRWHEFPRESRRVHEYTTRANLPNQRGKLGTRRMLCAPPFRRTEYSAGFLHGIRPRPSTICVPARARQSRSPATEPPADLDSQGCKLQQKFLYERDRNARDTRRYV